MTKSTILPHSFSMVKGRKVKVSFSGGDVTSDGGSLLLRKIDKKLGLLRDVSKAIPDLRQRGKCVHTLINLLRQRVYGLALGYEDLNDHTTLRKDIGFQTSVGSDKDLGSSPTLCRLENQSDRRMIVEIHKVLLEKFISSFKRPPQKLVLDFDATDDPLFGKQEGRFFHGYYDSYCFLPLYVFCGDKLLVSYLRKSNIDPSKHAWAILSLLVKRFRKEWPEVEIVFRGDSAFCRHRLLSWCERNNVTYIVGIAKNNRLNNYSQHLHDRARCLYQSTKIKQRHFSDFMYAAKTWKKQRRVIVKAEHNALGSNPRYTVTNLKGESQNLYENDYCGRGDMENRIKEQQLDLFSGRTSAHLWWTNQFRLLLSSLAYLLVEGIRSYGLKGTELARAYCNTIRLKLLKIGAVITCNTRTIRFMLSSAYPYQALFIKVVNQLDTG